MHSQSYSAVQVWKEEDKFKRLLQLLGVWFEEGSILVFVDTQQKCDSLFGELMKSGCVRVHSRRVLVRLMFD